MHEPPVKLINQFSGCQSREIGNGLVEAKTVRWTVFSESRSSYAAHAPVRAFPKISIVYIFFALTCCYLHGRKYHKQRIEFICQNPLRIILDCKFIKISICFYCIRCCILSIRSRHFRFSLLQYASCRLTLRLKLR